MFLAFFLIDVASCCGYKKVRNKQYSKNKSAKNAYLVGVEIKSEGKEDSCKQKLNS